MLTLSSLFQDTNTPFCPDMIASHFLHAYIVVQVSILWTFVLSVNFSDKLLSSTKLRRKTYMYRLEYIWQLWTKKNWYNTNDNKKPLLIKLHKAIYIYSFVHITARTNL
jgi:hypothetical protein